MAAHARVSGSKVKQARYCPPSVLAQAGLPNAAGRAAIEGTAAHFVGEQCLLALEFDSSHWVGQEVPVKAERRNGTKYTVQVVVTQEMVEAVNVYLEHLQPIIAEADWYRIEAKLDSLKTLDPDLGGSADFVALVRKTRTLYVRDYKHGVGVIVDPEENEQALTYATGCSLLPDVDPADFDVVSIGIIQPRARTGDAVKTWETDTLRLLEWGAQLGHIARETRNPDAKRAAGEHCQFCLVTAGCQAHYEFALDAAGLKPIDFFEGIEPALPSPDELTPEERAKRLNQAALLKKWIAAIEADALAQAIEGNPPLGFKAVRGRGQRVLKDAHGGIERLVMLTDLPQEMFFDSSPLSVAQIEKVLGKKGTRELGEYWAPGGEDKKQAENMLWHTKPGNPTLVPASDPRPAVSPTEMFDDVNVSELAFVLD